MAPKLSASLAITALVVALLPAARASALPPGGVNDDPPPIETPAPPVKPPLVQKPPVYVPPPYTPWFEDEPGSFPDGIYGMTAYSDPTITDLAVLSNTLHLYRHSGTLFLQIAPTAAYKDVDTETTSIGSKPAGTTVDTWRVDTKVTLSTHTAVFHWRLKFVPDDGWAPVTSRDHVFIAAQPMITIVAPSEAPPRKYNASKAIRGNGVDLTIYASWPPDVYTRWPTESSNSTDLSLWCVWSNAKAGKSWTCDPPSEHGSYVFNPQVTSRWGLQTGAGRTVYVTGPDH